MDDDEPSDASRVLRNVSAVCNSCWRVGATFAVLVELEARGGRVAAGDWRPPSTAFPPAPPFLEGSSRYSRCSDDEDSILVVAKCVFRRFCDN